MEVSGETKLELGAVIPLVPTVTVGIVITPNWGRGDVMFEVGISKLDSKDVPFAFFLLWSLLPWFDIF